MMAPVDGSGTWPAWMQRVLKRAFSGSLTAGDSVHQADLKVRLYVRMLKVRLYACILTATPAF